jgi:hypothetical protein
MSASLLQRYRWIYALVVVAAICLGVGLRSDAFWNGLGSDDYLHFAMLEGVYLAKRSPFDLYNFYHSAEEVKALKDFGTLPWLSDREFRLAMLRPLSSALIALDYWVFGNHVYAFYLHSVFWWILMVVAVAAVFAEVLPLPVAAVAVVLFTIDESNDVSFTWLANRNTVVSIGLGVIGLWAYIRWRRHGRKSAFILSVGASFLAVLGGEWSFAIFAYIFAFEFFGEQRPLRARIAALTPLVLLGGAFVLAQSALDYGALHSSVYVNPFSNPVLFITKASQRVPVFFADMVLGIPTYWWYVNNPWRQFFVSHGFFHPSVWKAVPAWKVWHVFLGYAAMVVFVFLFRLGMRSVNAEVRRALGWLVTGALLSLIPLTSSVPSERLTLPAQIGVCALFAAILTGAVRHLYDAAKARPPRLAFASLAILLIGLWLHGGYASMRSAKEVKGMRYISESVAKWSVGAPIDDAKVGQQRVVLINAIEHTTAVFLPFVRYAFGHPLPRSYWTLSTAPFAQDVKRTAPNQLELTVIGNIANRERNENFYRDERAAVKEGDTARLEGLTVELGKLTDGVERTLRFTFAKPLEDPGYLFLYSTRFGFRRFILPAVGATRRLPVAPFPDQRLLKTAVALQFRDPKRTRQYLQNYFRLY